MTDFLKKLLDPLISNEDLDKIMKQLVKNKFDQDLRKEYAAYLEEELDVKRSQAPLKSATKGRKNKLILTFLALLSIGVIIYFLISKSDKLYQSKVQKYLAENALYYQGGERAALDSNTKMLSEAMMAVNNQQFEEASALLAGKENLNKTEKFFYAYALMRTERYSRAKNLFAELLVASQPGVDFYQESTLFKSYCETVLDPSNANIENIQNHLRSFDWAYSEYIKMLKIK